MILKSNKTMLIVFFKDRSTEMLKLTGPTDKTGKISLCPVELCYRSVQMTGST
jgi:hypothetical protein